MLHPVLSSVSRYSRLGPCHKISSVFAKFCVSPPRVTNASIQFDNKFRTRPARPYATGYFPDLPRKSSQLPYLVYLNDATGALHMGGSSIFSNSTFESIGVAPTICYDLQKCFGYKHPTVIQELAFKAICTGQNGAYIIADQTGTGKTIAYLVPLFQLLTGTPHIKNRKRIPGAPRALILASNRELALQILKSVGKLSRTTRINTTLLIPGRNIRSQIEVLGKPFDLLITTPMTLLKFVSRKKVTLDHVEHVIIDEAENSLVYQQEITEHMMTILGALMKNEHYSGKRNTHIFRSNLIVVGSTITMNLSKVLRSLLPNFTVITTEKLHKPPANVKHHWYDVQSDEKIDLLCRILKEIPSIEQVIVFCNTVTSCRHIDSYLSKSGQEITTYHREVLVRMRELNFKEFVRNEKRILVCTDIASRGIDFTNIKQIILFDFPLSAIDYINRVGRTARCGGHGEVHCFVTKKDRVLANSIKLANTQNANLNQLTPDVCDSMQELFVKKNTPQTTENGVS